MEKLVYVVWKKDQDSIPQFRQEMLGPTARALIDRGAHGLAMNLADEAAAALGGLRISQMPVPMTATVSIWVDTHLNRGPFEEALRGVASRLAGYLVLESAPLPGREHFPVRPGDRIPGLYTIAFIEKPDALTYDEWLDRWQGFHTKVAIETQSSFLYIQNAVVRPVTKDAPPWVAIVEEAFPPEAASDPMIFYAAGGSPEKLAENQQRMMDSCQRFIDFNRLESHPMSAYVLQG